MDIIALGTGTSQGVPVIGCTCPACLSTDPRDKRLRSSILVDSGQTKVQIDVGPDFRQQYLSNGLDSFDYLLISHEHNDHVIGLDELRAINFIQNKSIPIYGEARVLDEIKKRFHYAFSDKKYPGVPQLELVEIDLQSFKLGDINVTPLRISHGNLPILGFRLNNMAYITDASFINEETIEKIQGVDLLIINALRHEKHYSHFNLEEALEFIQKINPDRAFLSHISHAMGPLGSWESSLPDNVKALEDKMHLIV